MIHFLQIIQLNLYFINRGFLFNLRFIQIILIMFIFKVELIFIVFKVKLSILDFNVKLIILVLKIQLIILDIFINLAFIIVLLYWNRTMYPNYLYLMHLNYSLFIPLKKIIKKI